MSKRLSEESLKQMDEIPDWVDRHSVTCCLCGDLADERETTHLGDDREAHSECIDEIKVESRDLQDDNIDGYAVMRTRVKIYNNVGVLWQGEITDAGGSAYGDFNGGSVKEDPGYESFEFPPDLARAFGTDMNTLTMGNAELPSTTAKDFINNVTDKKIVGVELVKGSYDSNAGDCQFEFTLEDGYSFVG